MNATIRVVVGAAMLLTLARGSAGSTIFEVDGVPVVWPGAQSVRYLSPTTFPPGSESETLILAAMGLWNIVPATHFEYLYSPLDQDFPIDHFDGFNDTQAVSVDQLDPGVLGVTIMVNDGATWFDTDVLFSDFPAGVGYNLDPNPTCEVVTAPTPTNGFSFLLVATHEMGHALGLGHDPIGDEPPGTPWFVGTMNPRYPSGGPIGQYNIVELHTDDRNGLRRLYPSGGSSGPPSADLALADYVTGTILGQAVPLPLAPSVVFPGESFTVESLIENFGSTSEFGVSQGFYLSTDATIDTGDLFLGALTWDIAFEDALAFGVTVDMPDDLAPGTYHVGSILDDLGRVSEVYEDNNAASYCEPLTVAQLPPSFTLVLQDTIDCGPAYTGPTPSLGKPLNMSPVSFSLDAAPPGMTIDAGTGVVSWPIPTASTFPYAVTLRATNGAGSTTQTLFLLVRPTAPLIAAMPDTPAACQGEYIGATPQLVSPRCMEPILAWSLDTGPVGMSINPATGVVHWTPDPFSSPSSLFGTHPVTIRASNAAGSTTAAWRIHVTAGDLNADGAVDLSDYAALRSCLRGPGAATSRDCPCGDADMDGDVDLQDVGRFQRALTH